MAESFRHIVRRIYGEVLFELAQESGTIEIVTEDLARVRKVLRREPDFAAIMRSETIKGQEKTEVIRRVFGGSVSKLTLHFLSVLARRNRMGILTGVCDRYEMLVDDFHHRSLIEVTLAKEPNDEQMKKLKADLSEAINGKVKLSVKVAAAIIGGIIIKKGDQVIDNSVRMMLQRGAGRIKNLEVRI